ncbi:MAG TPA: type II secretion system protein GspC [Aquificaceae bacterium]|nr:type II secretion system protein GspC [Aquificaceae bacterium]
MIIYAIGFAFSSGVAVSLLISFFLFKESLKVQFVPKVREEKEISAVSVAKSFEKFFNYTEEIKVKNSKPTSENISALSFKIKGLILSDSLEGVILLDGNKYVFLEKGKDYKGYTLSRVKKDRAVFRKGGREFEIPFEPEKMKEGKISTRRTYDFPQREIVVSKREIERITKDPAKMFTQIRLVPYVRGGKTEGFIFEWVKPGSIFHRMGIRRGDILVSINNMTITSGEDAFRILQMIRNEPNLKVVLIRRGKREEINVRIE